MPAVLQFDEAQHRYSIGERPLISVTQALTEGGLIDTRWFSEEAALRGTYVHQAILMHVEGDLAEESLDPVLRPFYDAYRSFVAASGFVVEACEERLYDETLGYAGTLDLRGHFPRPALRSRYVDVIDIKTGHIPSWVGYQTAAYCRLLPRELPPVRWRWALNLRADGTYKLEPLEKRTDESVFLAALTVAQAKRGWL